MVKIVIDNKSTTVTGDKVCPNTGKILEFPTGKTLSTIERSEALVDCKMISSQDARRHFEKVADKHGFSNQQRQQYIAQALTLAINLAEKFERETAPQANTIQETVWTPMGKQQQIGAILPMTDDEREALRLKQLEKQRRLLTRALNKS